MLVLEYDTSESRTIFLISNIIINIRKNQVNIEFLEYYKNFGVDKIQKSYK